MVRARIYRHLLDEKALEDVSDLLEQAGCASEDIDIVAASPGPLPLGGDEVLVFVLTPSALNDPDLPAVVRGAQSGGRRAVCIWPPGQSGETPPDWAKKFAYSTPRWDADELRKVLANDDAVCVQSSDGIPLQVQTHHEECEEEKK